MYRKPRVALPKAPCDFVVHARALMGLPCHKCGVCVCNMNIKLHGAVGL